MAKTATRKGVVPPEEPVDIPAEKHAGGRPTLYNPEKHPQQAYEMCLLGATDEQMARALGIATSTLYLWKNEHPQFSEAINEGKDIADAKVAASLYQRALGYSHADVDIRVVGQEIIETPVIKQYPPDATSAIFWLKNRQKDQWRDRTVQEHSGPNEGPIVTENRTVTNYRDLQAKAKAKKEQK